MIDSGSSSGRDLLIASLWQDTKREAESNLQSARAEALNLVENATVQRERKRELACEKAREEAVPIVARILNQARGEAEKAILQARYALLEECYEKAKRLLMDDHDTVAAIRSCLGYLLRQAVSALDSPIGTRIHVNPDDVDTSRSILEELGLDIRIVGQEDILGGALVRIGDGSRIIDNSVMGRLRTLRKTPPVRILSLLNPHAEDKRAVIGKPHGESADKIEGPGK